MFKRILFPGKVAKYGNTSVSTDLFPAVRPHVGKLRQAATVANEVSPNKEIAEACNKGNECKIRHR